MVKQSSPRDLLLIASTQRISPLSCHIPAAFALYDMIHFDNSEDEQKVIVRYAPWINPGKFLDRDKPQGTDVTPSPLSNEGRSLGLSMSQGRDMVVVG
jgi:hypothetical protein